MSELFLNNTSIKRLGVIEERIEGDMSLDTKMRLYRELKMSIIPELSETYKARGLEVLAKAETQLKGILKDKILESYDRLDDKSLFLQAVYDSAIR